MLKITNDLVRPAQGRALSPTRWRIGLLPGPDQPGEARAILSTDVIALHITQGFDAEAAARLPKRLRGAAAVTHGPEPAPSTEVWVTGQATADQIAALPGLKSIVVPWAGVPEKLAEAVLASRGVTLHNLHHNSHATAEMAMALLLGAARLIPQADAQIRRGEWGMRFGGPEPILLAGSTVLVLGWGAIGQRVGKACRALGMKVLGVRRTAVAGSPAYVHPASELGRLLPQADALVVCLPLTPETRGMIGEKELGLMPRGSLLVNVGRGAVVDERSLYEALSCGQLAAAGIDVWYRYPKGEEACLPSSLPFQDLPNVVMSPHRAGAAARVESERASHLASLVRAMARGDFGLWRCDPSAGY